MDTTELSSFVQYLRHQRLVNDFVFLSAAAIYFYDYFLTLHLEIKLIWRARWSYTTALVLLIRYMGFLSIILVLYNQLVPNLSAGTCKILFPFSAWLLVTEMSLAEAMLAVRTWAVWQRNRYIGLGLAARIPAMLFVQFYFVNKFNRALTYHSTPYPGFRGCFVSTVERNIWQNYVMLTVAEATILALMIISAFRSYRRGSNSELSYIIHRDGILFYIYIFLFTVANLVITIVLPIDMGILLSPLEDALYSVLTARVVLNIRFFGNRSRQVDLHTSFDDAPAAITLQFVVDGNCEDSQYDMSATS